MSTVLSEYVRLRGILAPDGSLPWRRFRTTRTPRVLIDDPNSDVETIQIDEEGREQESWGLPTRLVDEYGSPAHSPQSDVRIVSGTFPLYRSTERFRLEVGYELVEEIEVPTVRPRFAEPLRASEVDEGYLLRWRVDPGTREELEHDLLCSGDGGASWERIAGGLESSEVVVSREMLEEGEETLVAVEAWDGFYTATERGRIVDIMEPELDIRILHPRAGRRHEVAPVLLEAIAFVDDEIGPIPDEAIAWYVGETKVASGTRAIWSEPEAGRHEVTVRVEYDGSVAEAHTRCNVSDTPVDRPQLRETGT